MGEFFFWLVRCEGYELMRVADDGQSATWEEILLFLSIRRKGDG
jgi:hypothetical protein